MTDFNSKYSGEQVEQLLDQVASGNAGGGGGGIAIETDPIFSASPAASITEEKKAEWDNKVDKVDGKQLSTEDFTTALKNKLSGLSNYDDTEISNAIESLRQDFNTLVSGDTTTAIKSFNDITAFLEGIEDSESLDSIIASIEQQIAAKGTYSKPSTGIPKSDLANAVQTSLDKADNAFTGSILGFKSGDFVPVLELSLNGETKTPNISGKLDLGTVLTEHQSLSNYYTKQEIDSKITSSINNAINSEY